ncbi:MAG: methyltransferase domain-containing protein [Deltaproteobacteria bacterium]|nr:methyltransferase domain-containing protein [Deltaproteobacteria bacterium]
MHTFLGVLCVLLPRAGGDHPPGGHHAAHGNPADLGAYIAHLEDPARDAWQKPDELVKALGLKPGQVACDVGAGPGYFSLRLARAVGPTGRVFAVDVEPGILAALVERLTRAKVQNVTPVLGAPDDPLLPAGACDTLLVVDTYHHFPDRVAYLGRLKAAVKRGGTLVIVDFHKRPLPVGPPPERKLSREQVLQEAAQAGWKLSAEHALLPHQYVLVFQPG